MKFKVPFLLGFICLILLVGVGCEDELHKEDNLILSDQPMYSTSGSTDPIAALDAIELLLLKLSEFEEFRSVLVTKIHEKFDGDANVLLKDLTEISFENESIVFHLDQISNQLDVFDDVEGERLFPQVFIPFFDELDAAGLLRSQPIRTIIYLSTPETESEEYLPNGNELVDGKISAVNEISAESAMGKETWVVSINERVTQEGEVDLGRAPGPPAPAPLVGLELNFMTIREHNESWLAGGSEIHFSAARTWQDGGTNINTATYSAMGVTAIQNDCADFHNVVVPQFGFIPPHNVHCHPSRYRGELVRWYSRNEVSNNDKKYIHQEVVNQWDMNPTPIIFENNPNFLGFAIFEFDTWPAATNLESYNLENGITGNAMYRSSNSSYLCGRLVGTHTGSPIPQAHEFYYNQAPFEVYFVETTP